MLWIGEFVILILAETHWCGEVNGEKLAQLGGKTIRCTSATNFAVWPSLNYSLHRTSAALRIMLVHRPERLKTHQSTDMLVAHHLEGHADINVGPSVCPLSVHVTRCKWMVPLSMRWPWTGCGPAPSPPRCTKCNSPPINVQCTNHCIMMVRCAAVLMWRLKG